VKVHVLCCVHGSKGCPECGFGDLGDQPGVFSIRFAYAGHPLLQKHLTNLQDSSPKNNQKIPGTNTPGFSACTPPI
jgi:hypothetical protein